MEHTYSSWLSRPLAALALLLATAGMAHAQPGALVKAIAPQSDPALPTAQARPVSATVTAYKPLGTAAQARQQALAAAAVATTTVTFSNTQQGWFSPQRGRTAANFNYIVGVSSVFGSTYHNFFTFPLTNLNLTGKQVVGATLSVVDNGIFDGTSATVTYVLHDVSTPAATLGAGYAVGDPVITSVYNDLGTGQTYGSYASSTTVTGGRRVYTLTAAALADITARAGQNFSIGGMLLEEQTLTNTYLFGATGLTDNGTGNGQQILTLELADVAPTITVAPTALPSGTVGVAYSQTITAAGGTSPYTYAITAGALPSGLTLTSGGVLSGTPRAGGSFTFNVTATDANGFTGTRAYTFTSAAPTITVAPATLPSGTVGAAYSQAITASGGTSPYTYAITAGALPSGLTLNAAGTLAGTPTASGSFTFTVRATDASTGSGPYSGSRVYTLTIAPQPAPAAPVAVLPVNNSTTNSSPVFQVTATPGTVVTVYLNGPTPQTSQYPVGSNGVVIAQYSGLADGVYTLYATASAQRSGAPVSAPSNTLTFTVDATAPSVTLSSATVANGGTTTTSPVAFTAQFSEPVGTTFTASDLVVSGGTVSNFAAGTAANSYTFTLTPAVGPVSVRIAAGAAQDAVGNDNTAASYAFTYALPVTAAPVLTSPANNSTLATGLLTYQGTAPAGSIVTVYVNNASIGTTTAPSGSFSLTQPTVLAPGQYAVYATAQLSGQTVSAASNTNTFTVATPPTVTLLSPATGPVGTQVTISGTNLAGTTAVRFNGTLASSFVVNSATSITAVVAAGTTTGRVTVTTPSGTAASPYDFVVRVAPTTVADSYSTPQGVTLMGNVLTNDMGTNPRAILINRPTNGVLVLNPDGSFRYQPNASFTGTDTFTYYACDPSLPLLCGNPATVTISVLRIAPVTVADAYTTPAGVTLTGNVLTNDLGTNPRAILINRPTNGVLVLNPDGSFRYTPNAGFVGQDTFTYYACDPNLPLLCGNPATVTITVTRVAPITVADAYTTPPGVLLTGNVLTNDIGTNPRAILINRPTRGTLVLNPDGSFTYQPTAGFSGTDSFTYYACNMGAPLVCGDPATVTITVTPAPTATRVASQPVGAPPTAAATPAKPTTNAAGGATIARELALSGYPNPFRDELQLSFTLPIAQAYTLAVYDAQGRLVQQLASSQAEAGQAQQLTVPTLNYATGLYLVRLTTTTGTRLLKVLKH